MVEYDENSNPRNLRAVDPQAVEETVDAVDALEREVERLGKKRGVFTSKGWQLIQQDIVTYWQGVDARIRSHKTPIEDVPFLRGQLVAFEAMLNLGERTLQHYETMTQQLEQARALVEELEAHSKSAPFA